MTSCLMSSRKVDRFVLLDRVEGAREAGRGLYGACGDVGAVADAVPGAVVGAVVGKTSFSVADLPPLK